MTAMSPDPCARLKLAMRMTAQLGKSPRQERGDHLKSHAMDMPS